jgi:hypothetical protein
VIVATTLLVAVSITETVSVPVFVTWARFPSGVMATPKGPLPTVIGVPTTMLVDVSITETVPEPQFVT